MESDHRDRGPEMLACVSMACLVGTLLGVAFGLILNTPVGGLLVGMISGNITLAASGWYIDRKNAQLDKNTSEEV